MDLINKTRNMKANKKPNYNQLAHSYCAFLRGVNVKGTTMKMAETCKVFENAGLTNVTSVLASGNILFSSSDTKLNLKTRIEKALSNHFSYEAFLFIKDKDEVDHIFHHNPFSPNPDFHIYGFVGIDGIEKILQAEFDKADKAAGEESKIVAGNFYWKVPKGNTLESDFGKILGRKNLKNAFTSRNINTFEKVLKKM